MAWHGITVSGYRLDVTYHTSRTCLCSWRFMYLLTSQFIIVPRGTLLGQRTTTVQEYQSVVMVVEIGILAWW